MAVGRERRGVVAHDERGSRHREVRADPTAADLSRRVHRRRLQESRPPNVTAGPSGCSIAKPTPPRSRATATPSSICTPAPSSSSSATPRIPYPFGKFDFVAIPAFQFGGMEHAGKILYNASGLLLDESATQNQLLGRAVGDRARDRAHVVRRSGDDAVVQRRVDERGLREFHGGEDRQSVVPEREPRPALPAVRTTRRPTKSTARRARIPSVSSSTT